MKRTSPESTKGFVVNHSHKNAEAAGLGQPELYVPPQRLTVSGIN